MSCVFLPGGAQAPEDDGRWSDTYWGHHRNSLLLSSGLLLASIPGSNLHFGFLQSPTEQTSPTAIALTVVVFAMGAIYAITTLTFEWLNEAYRTYRLRSGLAQTTTDGIRSASESLQNAVETSGKQMDILLETLTTVSSTPRLILSQGEKTESVAKTLAEVIADSKAMKTHSTKLAHRIFNNLPVQTGGTGLTIPDEQKRGIIDAVSASTHLEGMPLSEALAYGLNKEHAGIFDHEMDTLRNYTKGLSDSYQKAAATFPISSSKLASVEKFVKAGMIAIGIRAIFIGIVIPWVLFLIAFSHGFGRLIYRLCDSWIIAFVTWAAKHVTV